MSNSNNLQASRTRSVQVMLQVSDACVLPGFVFRPKFFPFGSVTATVRSDKLDQLGCHPGVLGVWLRNEERREHKSRHEASVNVLLQVPAELAGQLAALFPALVAKGAHSIEVFSYARAGEPAYWLAFIGSQEGRHVVGTPDIRNLALEEQAPDLVSRLRSWHPSPRPATFD